MRSIILSIVLLLLSGQQVATKEYVDQHASAGGSIPPNANLPGSPTTTTQPPATNDTTIATTAFVQQEIKAATSIVLYSGLSVQGTHLAPGATEIGTLNVAGVRAGSSCTLTSGTLPPVGLMVVCSTSDGVITITRRNETTDSIDTTTGSYTGAVLQ
jgi:hypothetical protein